MATRRTAYERYGKRAMDVAGGSLVLLVSLPIMALVAVAVYASLGRPVLFRQRRPGLHGKPFVMLKFRTMTEGTDEKGARLADGRRLTRVGRILRASSLDELPEILNVLAGDMSLVGPRPLLMEYLPRYSTEQARRHAVKPGITGLAQAEGRNALSWQEKFRLDVQYVDAVSFRLDVKILWRTLLAVLAARGISQPGRATMDEFFGDTDK